ncbi:hypothetical protein PAXRUDRAFT_16860 [Paxillus rubicundulus Ve08.2h10]|uniref:Uncharacterized protein n=1 Tax=Paxillus rubicundulus Ve08.2h10 TaxID=930991 RepID=A0A0D0D4F0_9AGAM|nr:hypothetical protein PAXRUDRAFT_16860 [Paxillus rubicundulus Ve08.2h10]
MPAMIRPETGDTIMTLVPDQDFLPLPAVQRKRSRDSGASTATFVNVKGFLLEEVDHERAITPLTAYCFMTGFIPKAEPRKLPNSNAVCFSAIFAWCASQTGNTIQLSIATAWPSVLFSLSSPAASSVDSVIR